MNTLATTGARVGVDVGGTFTDFVLFDPIQQQYFFHKQPSTPDDPAHAVRDGLLALLHKSDLPASAIAFLLHGTTLGLNAIIQRRGARIALVVSRGFRDVLEIGRARLPSSFDFHADREPPFLPRQRVLEIPARFTPQGEWSSRPTAEDIATLATQIQALEVSAVALMTINGYANPQAEAELAQQIGEQLLDIPVLSAAQLWPEIREYERTLVAGLNAYIQPLMQRYFSRLAALLQQEAISAQLLITASNGGVLPLESARQRPVDTLLSGPASGVSAAAQLVKRAGGGGFLSFDMGGTSSDMSLSLDGDVARVTRTDIGGLPLILPVVGVSAIGAGGGSVVHVDDYGILKVGPESAGAEPGPVAYARGGDRPTLTDCYLVSGIVPADTFLGGTMPLDVARARTALTNLAIRLGFSDEDAAQQAASGALAVATTQMATELNKVLAQQGASPDVLTLVPFGGAGPTHANLLADEAGISRILVPLRPGTFCAQGAVTADIRHDFVRSLRVTVSDDTQAPILAALAALRDRAQAWFVQQGAAFSTRVTLGVEADMRYTGQAYELTVSLGEPDSVNVAALLAAFTQRHRQHYGFVNADGEVALTTLRLSLTAWLPVLPDERATLVTADTAPTTRRFYFRQRWHDAAIWQRNALREGDALKGPAIVEQEDTTTLILPGWQGSVDMQGNLLIVKRPMGDQA
ncbi:5-oxoprolinase [Pectobacterium araliae]|uniref:Hydantoinase/oxoprolinase family protein n=1 Tax=Pectobacterium araliae TaxID=3073862 RepID=A0AAN0KB61_9GAMM|nr:hydantoinase/oxoprolinase family protein [Pectobacterium sp. MAFF 302110]GKW19881.1 5-oxoprolinase [Pectobacterium carotovorum subsp. carotovorum]